MYICTCNLYIHIYIYIYIYIYSHGQNYGAPIKNGDNSLNLRI